MNVISLVVLRSFFSTTMWSGFTEGLGVKCDSLAASESYYMRDGLPRVSKCFEGIRVRIVLS